MFAHCRPYLVLALLWLGYFHPLVLSPTGVLWGDFSDFEAEHLPAKLFLNREWRTTGELPLWNPNHFCGTPFVHDIQVGVFYPPYAVTYLVPESAVGGALSWVIALHTLLAGVTTFLYVRQSRGTGELAALLAAAGVMLSAKWMTHLLLAGHTITVGLAWLPLVLWGLEAAIRRGGLLPILGTGIAVALLVLGTHPQWAFYSAVFAALWTLGTAVEVANGRVARALLRLAVIGLAVGAVALALTAVQLLPTAEASGQSARTVELSEPWSGKLVLARLSKLVGPEVEYNPPTPWESRSLLGAVGLAVAVAGAVRAGGRRWWELAVVLLLLVFTVFGGFIVQHLPGFQLFRIPHRMSLILIYPVCLLVADAMDRARQSWNGRSQALIRWLAPAIVLALIAPALTCFTVVELNKGHPKPLWPPFVAYWIAVGIGFPLLIVAAWLPDRLGGLRAGILAAILVAEQVVPVAGFVTVRPADRVFPPSPLQDELAARGRPGVGRVADWYVVTPGKEYKNSPQGMGAATSLSRGYETLQGYNPLDVRHYREFLNCAAGGEGRLASLHPLTLPILPNVPTVRHALFDHLNLVALAVPDGFDTKQLKPDRWTPVGRFPGPEPLPLISPDCPRPLPNYTLYQNPTALPRAWVVPTAARMPDGNEAAALAACDFRKTVLLAGEESFVAAPAGRTAADVRVAEYTSNRVVIDTDGGTGWLVLADVWFPGWVCHIDGVEVPIRRANHAFRAVELPAGTKRVEFRFEPKSYRIGWWVSAMSVGIVTLSVGGLTFRRWAKGNRAGV